MKSGTALAVAAVLLVAIAVGGVILVQRQAAQQARLSNEQRIGRGVGDLVGGIVGLAMGSDQS